MYFVNFLSFYADIAINVEYYFIPIATVERIALWSDVIHSTLGDECPDEELIWINLHQNFLNFTWNVIIKVKLVLMRNLFILMSEKFNCLFFQLLWTEVNFFFSKPSSWKIKMDILYLFSLALWKFVENYPINFILSLSLVEKREKRIWIKSKKIKSFQLESFFRLKYPSFSGYLELIRARDKEWSRKEVKKYKLILD